MWREFTEEAKRKWDVVATWVAILGAILGGLFAILEHNDSVRREQTQRSMEYLGRFGASPVLDERMRMQQGWDAITPEMMAILDSQKLSKAEKEARYSQLLCGALRGDADWRKSVLMLMEFLEEVQLCVEARVCDGESIRVILGRQARTLYNGYFPFLRELREQWRDPSIGERLRLLARVV